jgi:hypothetical protein
MHIQMGKSSLQGGDAHVLFMHGMSQEEYATNSKSEQISATRSNNHKSLDTNNFLNHRASGKYSRSQLQCQERD